MTLLNAVNIPPRSSQTANVPLNSNTVCGLVISGNCEVSASRSVDGSLFEDAILLDDVHGTKYVSVGVAGCSSLRVQVANNSDASQNVTVQAGAQ